MRTILQIVKTHKKQFEGIDSPDKHFHNWPPFQTKAKACNPTFVLKLCCFSSALKSHHPGKDPAKKVVPGQIKPK